MDLGFADTGDLAVLDAAARRAKYVQWDEVLPAVPDLIDDAARLDELLYVAGAPAGHPFATFTWGHAESLRHGDASAVAAVKALYRDHYHASNMKLCLVAPAALDETEAWCRESFAHVCAGVAIELRSARWRGGSRR